MELIKSENYETHLCNFYEDANNEVWLTREQVGAALGYADPAKSIQNIHLKHKDRLDKFIKREKVKTAERGDSFEHHQSDGSRGNTRLSNLQSEVVYYSERGVMEICRWSDMPKANEFMDWVWDIVEAYRHNEVVANKHAIQSLKTQLLEQDEKFNMLSERVEQVGVLVQNSVQELKTEVFSHIDLLESKSEIMLTHETDWAMEMMEHVRKIADVYTQGDTSKCMDRLVERAEEYLGEPYKNYEADYALRHNGKRGKKIFVMARDEDSRSAFEQAVKDFEIEWGIYEQNEGQKYLEKILDGMGEMIVPDPPVPYHEMTNAELEAEYEAMTKMYGEGWDKQPTVEETYGN